ncbi:ClpX C4-type zinc finger protein [Nocardioides sp. BP30]|uniref:ClpX C4-type zinc finger protein n=1 Tax=Nocardioides sp. BP30 TaxID=3036374 RepID=UPI002468DABE|nr:ClpX C4-type zinc finger protein [Nocardioides sp. BP30]WGL53080.1 ClpX C4-type zinc finger protein [Nocardioides sp. BP30]
MDNDVERKSCSFCGVRGTRGMRFAGGLGAMICEPCVAHFHQMFASPEQVAKASRPPWESMTDAELLSKIPMISTNADQVADFLVEWVELARARKISWAEIGKAMGISRQGAWERFAPRMNATGATASSASTVSTA